ncbi:MAG: hypothetical protein KatS3mg019_2006 [Fimbriimonadales bacterium]|nr:MAG: hypothetical protein KatS3mg019_2006 [Fimbriimonadales bacterium]
MIRTITALGFASVLVATTCAQVVLGDNKGKVRKTNALATISAAETSLQWSRRDFQDGTNSESIGFWPAYTIQNANALFDIDGENVGFGDDTGDVTITTVDSLINTFSWPATFTVPRFLFKQGGAYTNNSNNGDHSVIGPVWIKYELDESNPSGWDVSEIRVFAWDVRDLLHKSNATKARPFSDTAAPQRIDIYVAQADPNPSSDPANDQNWVYVGSLDKANGTLPNVCQWDASTGNTFGECPQATIDYLNGNNPQGLKFYQDPTNPIWYSTLRVRCLRNIKYVALVIPQGNQYGQDPDLNASNRTSSSLRYTNFTDVRVIAGAAAPEGDVDGNGCVDDADLLQVLFNFGATGANDADVNCDQVVDDADLLVVLFNFGSGC